MIITITIFFSSISFLIYGITCLTTLHMKNEFIRFGLEKKRPLTGVLQLLGSIGLTLGYLFSPLLVIVSSAGLAILMILGFGVRLQIKDGLISSSPAFIYAILNGYICIYYLSGPLFS